MTITRRQLLTSSVAALAASWGDVDIAFAKKLSYHLDAVKIAPDSYCIFGKREAFNMANGGDIVNIPFIDTSDGVVLIDTGSCRRHGEAIKMLIRRLTGKEVVRVFITHFHPDHCLGNQAFDTAKIAALETCAKDIETHGDGFADGLYRILGDWMRGTQVAVPKKIIKQSSETIGGHKFEFIGLKGHTASDMAILDHTTGVLYAGDLAFYNRAATTPHANLNQWFHSLDQLAKIPYKSLLPGHGPLDTNKKSIVQTRDYLTWLDGHLQASVAKGLDMIDAARGPVPDRFDEIALTNYELERSVAHLYANYEDKAFTPGAPSSSIR